MTTIISGVLHPTITSTRLATVLSALVPKDQMSAEQLEIETIRENWNRIRHLDAEDIKDEPEEYQEAHKRFYDKLESDFAHMLKIAEKLEGYIEPPRVQKKSKGQRKRDRLARDQEWEASDAAKELKLTLKQK